MKAEFPEEDVHGVKRVGCTVSWSRTSGRGRLCFWNTRLFHMRDGFYLIYSKCVICVSLYVLIDPTPIISLAILLIISFTFLWIWPVLSFSHFISFCWCGSFRPLGTYFLFYDAIGIVDCMTSVIGWLANDGLGNVWKEVFMA